MLGFQKPTTNPDLLYPASNIYSYSDLHSEDVDEYSSDDGSSLIMPVIPFFPNFPRFVNTDGRRRKRRDYKATYSNFTPTNSDNLELLGSTACQVSTPGAISAAQYLSQQYVSQLPQTHQTQYDPSQYAVQQYPENQPAPPFAPVQQRSMSDSYLLPTPQHASLAATGTGYQVPQPALSSPPLYQPISTSSMYQPALVTPVIPSSTSNNYLTYTSTEHGHRHSLPLASNVGNFDQKNSKSRTLPQPMSTGRMLSTLGAIPPSGLSLFGLTPEQQAFLQQRRLPPPPPPQPRIYSFENSTQTTIAETLALTKENKEKRANSGSPRSKSRSGDLSSDDEE
ncbi:hypothetical protein AA313_de0206191 [Arthrobotrys entomopaga]|nr:hypothetical protein AA313_de0206191 [Arthrobotrys entomopaga]